MLAQACLLIVITCANCTTRYITSVPHPVQGMVEPNQVKRGIGHTDTKLVSCCRLMVSALIFQAVSLYLIDVSSQERPEGVFRVLKRCTCVAMLRISRLASKGGNWRPTPQCRGGWQSLPSTRAAMLAYQQPAMSAVRIIWETFQPLSLWCRLCAVIFSSLELIKTLSCRLLSLRVHSDAMFETLQVRCLGTRKRSRVAGVPNFVLCHGFRISASREITRFTIRQVCTWIMFKLPTRDAGLWCRTRSTKSRCWSA